MTNKIIMAAVCLALAGCASSRYPGYESVNIVSSVENKPCVRLGVREQCNDGSKADCDIWFKKRATLVSANTVVIQADTGSYLPTGRYYNCQAGNLPYQSLIFNKQEYGPGLNTVTGQAFLTQKGGGVVTCAGNRVEMHPDTEYFTDIFDGVDRGLQPDHELSKDAKDFLKESQCDAQGNFEFHKIPAGKWIITAEVRWDVSFVRNNGFFYYTATSPQGGYMSKSVNVKDGDYNKFIIAE
ncbi:MAG: hypothetical protein QX203_00935 [Methylococcaceae bacterium]